MSDEPTATDRFCATLDTTNNALAHNGCTFKDLPLFWPKHWHLSIVDPLSAIYRLLESYSEGLPSIDVKKTVGSDPSLLWKDSATRFSWRVNFVRLLNKSELGYLYWIEMLLGYVGVVSDIWMCLFHTFIFAIRYANWCKNICRSQLNISIYLQYYKPFYSNFIW